MKSVREIWRFTGASVEWGTGPRFGLGSRSEDMQLLPAVDPRARKHVGGRCFTVRKRCPHRGALLCAGRISDLVITKVPDVQAASARLSAVGGPLGP